VSPARRIVQAVTRDPDRSDQDDCGPDDEILLQVRNLREELVMVAMPTVVLAVVLGVTA
jgi:hypothetical protein